MISDFKQIETLFKDIDAHLQKNVHLYIIGGVVLLYQGLKPATKDIDLIIPTKEEFECFVQAVKTAGFQSKTPTGPYQKVNLNEILVRGDFRIDAFHKTVCRRFSLSATMRKRAKKQIEFLNTELYLCSNEDIFLFKTFTEREGDIQDCIALAQRGLDWGAILHELQTQIQQGGNDIWITWVGERLDQLIERGLTIPIMDRLDRLRDSYYKELESKNK